MYEKELVLGQETYEHVKKITKENKQLEQILYAAILIAVHYYLYDEDKVSIHWSNKWTNLSVQVDLHKELTLRSLMQMLLSVSKEGKSAEIQGSYDVTVAQHQYGDKLTEEKSKLILYYSEGILSFKYALSQKRIYPLISELFQRIVTAIDDYADRPIHGYCLENKEERKKICYEWQGKPRTERIKPFTEWFETAVENYANRIAVSGKERSFTYKELDEKAHLLAEQLAQKQVRMNEAIGVECANYPELLISIVAIAKVKGIFVPLDSSLPAEKRERILLDSGLRYILQGTTIKAFEGVNDDKAAEAIERNQELLQQEQGSYLIYTSGTTGEPKGCLVSERNMLNMCLWYQEEFKIDEESNVILLNNFSFDASIKNIYAPLMAGGRIVMGPENLFDTFDIKAIIASHKVTHLNCVPGLFDALLKTVEIENYSDLESVREVVLGGETFQPSAVKKWARLDRCNARFANVYGPAECTSVSTYYHCSKKELLPMDEVPIGCPINGKKLYLFNSKGNLCLPGMIGTLYLGGEGLINGYTKSELNQDKFLSNAFGMEDRLYNTGDLATYDEDGRVYYIGRKDHQIKINGQRIELEELEHALSRYPEIEHCAVNVLDHHLVAFYTTRTGQEVNHPEIQKFLKSYVSETAIPRTYIFLREMPRNNNGKINRMLLNELSVTTAKAKDTATVSGSDLRLKLIQAWQAALDVKNVSITQNFFEQGGTSLLLYKLKIEIKKYTGHDIEMVDILNYPSIHTLEKWLNKEESGPVEMEKQRISRKRRNYQNRKREENGMTKVKESNR
ncbi:non-ribosomal peptide synthetase [Clostridium aminobutyricum]|uniref:Non-ribosomal peptide synthetase n=1 Tax=Clostridium aminobutyricum TaxID=33953 RepID=A0A939D9Y9_CLOAM|nr:non-ribosomal peptide synthetase [Clostridium aminobutyricum]MBN7773941.1 non-ribosomal peptide synthetase [Clostridium aminobutyricum]